MATLCLGFGANSADAQGVNDNDVSASGHPEFISGSYTNVSPLVRGDERGVLTFNNSTTGTHPYSLPRKGGTLTGTPTGFAAEAPTPTLDNMNTKASSFTTTSHYDLTTTRGSNTNFLILDNGSGTLTQYWYTPNEGTAEKNNILNYLTGVALVPTDSTTDYVFVTPNGAHYTFDMNKSRPTSTYTYTGSTVDTFAFKNNPNDIATFTDSSSGVYYDNIYVSLDKDTKKNYYLNIDPTKASSVGPKLSNIVWSDSKPSDLNWAKDHVAGSVITISDDTITGAIRLKKLNNTHANWKKYFTYVYKKPNYYTITQTKLNDNVTEEAVNKKVFARTVNSSDGGAIYNTKDISAFDIIADFVGNYSYKYGGAIYNSNAISSITGDFVGNYSSKYGGAIYNSNTIGSIAGDFVGNSSYEYTNSTSPQSLGGAIYNIVGTIGSITGNFVGNCTHAISLSMFGKSGDSTYSSGGAIYNSRTIGSIAGDFVGNFSYAYTASNASGKKSESYGGAVYNAGTISSIVGDFVGNFSEAHPYGSYPPTYSYGGAIYNSGTISTIIGNFVSNKTYASTYSYGGAVYNSSAIGSITGDFISNNASSGGAIYNNSSAQIGSITGDFIGNSASSGGAIYNSGTITLGGNTFTGNYTNLRPNSIYNAGVINIKNGATVTINDGWQSSNNAQLVMLGSNSILNMNIGNGTIQQDSLGKITNVGTINATVDVSVSQVKADTIAVTSATQNGVINIKGLNFIDGSPEDIIDQDLKIKILGYAAADEKLKLAIDESIKTTKVISETERVDVNNVAENTAWTDSATGTKIKTTVKGILDVATTTTTDDSIGVTVTSVDVDEGTVDVDTLKAVNQSTTATRNFNATVDGETYTATDDLGKAGAGTININGMPTGGESQGTIDLDGHKGFELDKATTLNLNDVVVTGASAVTGVIDGTSTDAVVNLSNSEIDGNVSNAGTVNLENDSSISGTVINSGEVNLENSQITGVVNNAGVLNLNEGAQLGSTVTGTGTTNINNDFTLNSSITGNDVVLNGAELTMGTMGMLSGANSFTVENGSTLNLQNGVATNTDLGNFVLNGDMALKIDGNFASKQIDTITATSFTNPNDSSISITNVNVLTPITDEQFSISPIGTMEDAGVKAALASAIEYNAGDIAMTPIYKYSVAYDKDNAMLQFTRSGGGGGGDLNPAVVAAPAATQVAAQVTMEQTFNYSFSNSDTFMLLPNAERVAIRNRNKYAIAENELPEGANPLYQIQDTSSAWFKPYVSFENVPFKNGPKVNVISYGALAGYDTDLKELKRGWARAWTGFVGYNGANLNYNGVTTNQNGGILGGTLTMYKGNFFNATTLSAGASVGENNTMYGHETTTSLLAGIGNKTGYNLEFIDGKFIVQPSLFLGYTFVKTFDYTNAAGVRIDSDPAHTFQISPGLKFIGNLKHGWQPYIGVNMVWNVLNNSHVKANSVVLPQMSVKPYVQYGIGLQKTIKEHFVAYGQAMIQNGGRNGISLTGGFRWAIGKKHKPIEKVQKDKGILKQAKNNKNEIKVSKKSVINSTKTDNKSVIKNPQPQKMSKIRAFFANMDGEPIGQSTITTSKAVISKI